MTATNQKRARLGDWMMLGVRKADGTVNASGTIKCLVAGTGTAAKIWKKRDKSDAWLDGVVGLDGNGRPFETVAQEVFGDGLYDFEVYDNATPTPSKLYTISDAFYGYEVVNVRDFGATGDGTTDDTAAVQEAINYCLLYANATPQSAPKLYFPAGTYKTTSSLFILNGNTGTVPPSNPPAEGGSYDFVCVELYGEARAFPNDGALFRKISTIKATSTDEPAICIEGARGVTIRDLAFEGQNTYTIPAPSAGSPPGATFQAAMFDDATFVVNGCRDERHSPYAAIAIDPYKNADASKVWQVDASGGPSYNDQTTKFNSAASGDCDPFPASEAIGDQFAVGMPATFDAMTLTISTKGVGGTIRWKYWNGSTWVALSGVTDGTTGFTEDPGSYAVTWTKPSGWAAAVCSTTWRQRSTRPTAPTRSSAAAACTPTATPTKRTITTPRRARAPSRSAAARLLASWSVWSSRPTAVPTTPRTSTWRTARSPSTRCRWRCASRSPATCR